MSPSTPCGSATTRWSRRSAWASGRPGRPEMEEDIALSNIALDQLGVARQLLTYAGELDGSAATRTRWPTCATTASSATACWSSCPTPARRDLVRRRLRRHDGQAALPRRRTSSCSTSGWPPRPTSSSPAVAAKARKESAYHLDHAAQWTVRLGDGTEESHRRMQAAVDDLWPYTHELFADDDLTGALAAAGVAPAPSSLRHSGWPSSTPCSAEATLDRPADGWAPERRPGRPAHRAPVATCWPRCRCCTAPTRGRDGDAAQRAGGRRPGGGPGDPGGHHRRAGHPARGRRGRRRPGRPSRSPRPTPAARRWT